MKVARDTLIAGLRVICNPDFPTQLNFAIMVNGKCESEMEAAAWHVGADAFLSISQVNKLPQMIKRVLEG